MTWESYEYVWNKEDERIEKLINGTFTQFPLKLAWAVTIHKSQGQSFNKIIIDMGTGAFVTGQTYVALSRCRSFEGITLKSRVNSKDIKVDERIKNFHNSKNQKTMERERFESIIKGMQDSLDKIEPLNIQFETKIKELETLVKQLQQQVSDLTKLNQTKDDTIGSITRENNNLKTSLSDFKSKTVNQQILLFILIAICLFLSYKLLIAQ